jgi:hypothetical protein
MHAANIVIPILLVVVIAGMWALLRDTTPQRPGRHRPDTAGPPAEPNLPTSSSGRDPHDLPLIDDLVDIDQPKEADQ